MRENIAKVAMCLLCALVAFAGNEPDRPWPVPDGIVEQIKAILSDQAVTYELDKRKNRVAFERIENWVKTRMRLNQKNMTRDKDGDWVCFKDLKRVNTPILLGGRRSGGVEPPPFHVFYVKEPQRRTFHKEIWKPTAAVLSDGELKALASEFIRGHQFVEETENDKMGDCRILSWKQRTVNRDGRSVDAMTVLRRATFSRTFQGMEVINSRQIVDIHPESRELIAYKSLEWTPINERSGKPASPVSLDEVLRQIREALADKPDAVIDHVKRAWFQTSGKLVPVLEIRTVFHGKDHKTSHESTILISIVENMPLEEDLSTADPPGRANRTVE